MDLVEREPIAQQRAGLRVLAPQRGDGEILDLVLLRVDAPAGGVRVAPFRTDGDVSGPTTVEPRREELLRPSVRAGRVEIADPGLVGRVQHRVRIPLHRIDAGVPAEVVAVPEVDVPGPPERGEPEPKRGDGQAGAAERTVFHRARK